ncbi:MAG: BamA/TamA family outer membrane protein [Spirochaetales bacterium]|nr:BamA/TamA family outer membrane protein [Spirochaetales bacterium]
MKTGLLCVTAVLLFNIGIITNLNAIEILGDPLVFDPDLRIWGADLGIGFRGVRMFPDLDTILWFYIGGGYENIGYFRTPDGRLYDGDEPGYDPETSPYYWRAGGRFDVGMAQGLIWNDKINKNGLEYFLFYRLRFNMHMQEEDSASPQLMYEISRDDEDGSLQNSIFTGVSWDDIDNSHPHRFKSGTYAEASAEWGPEFFLNDIFGRADFFRISFLAKAFLPLWDLNPQYPVNVLSMYLGVNIRLDYAFGSYLPLNVLNTFGGRKSIGGLGFALRGYEDYRYDAPFKVVANIELRTNLPAVILPNLIPGILVFFDSGYYDFIDVNEKGLLFSAGAGIYITLLDVSSLVFYTYFPLSQERVTGGYWVPFALQLGFHF